MRFVCTSDKPCGFKGNQVFLPKGEYPRCNAELTEHCEFKYRLPESLIKAFASNQEKQPQGGEPDDYLGLSFSL
jgi:hypothetical protein